MTDQSRMMEASLPSSAYLDDAAYALDKATIFEREWFCAGREEDVPEAGDHVILNVAGESILVVRDRAGALHAHYNVCRHRGARLCDAQNDARWGVTLDAGVVARNMIRCPYHGWSYGLDGRLLAAPHLQEEPGFDKGAYGLHKAGVATWGGFLFLNLTPDAAPSFEDGLRDPARRLGNYPLHALKTGPTISYDIAANWKVMLENYNECYHCPGVHPELCEVVPEFRKNGGIHLDWEAGIPHRDGAVTYTRSGTTTRSPFPGLTAEEQVRHKGELIYPNLMLSVSMDHAAAFILWPQGPGRTRIDCRFLFHPDEMTKPEFDPSDAVDFWDLVNRQDWAVCERVQSGMAARVHDHGYYSPMEDYSLDIRRYVADRHGR
ncbi:aromatic ring-hydroxylating oxygenase subunit alpha [Flavisphingomonas formosensis]|uniref:aromatic ring-hydroxylating oxygenase subunit alpha n=1 Tax=Flavisphingomonas formosensis TaxID=861534 RepID=UPI0018E02E97|nr:aromatic ring-hydroxylating dioxygenase subunit alpha [Sphingomonas formosensis]